MKTITKKDVARHVAQLLNKKAYTTEKIVDGVFDTLQEIMKGAEDEVRIEIRHFGVLEIKKTKPRPRARNPRTGEIVYVPARRKARFKPAKVLRESLKKPLKEE